MSLQVCGQCGTRYAVGIAACPHCSSTELAAEDVGRVPTVVGVHCPNEDCAACGRQRRVVLQRAAMGVVALPVLLCEVCGCHVVIRWPGELKEDSDMPKITVHGGASGGPQVVGGSWGDEQNTDAPDKDFVMVGEQGTEVVHLPAGSVVSGVEDETLGGPSKPLPEAVEDDTTEHVSEPDYDGWTARRLRAALAERKLSTAGNREVLIARLNDADSSKSDDEAGE